MSEAGIPRMGLPSWEGAASGAIATRAELLGKVELFAGLDRLALARLAAYVEPLAIEPGQVICQQGDPGDSLYVVVSGTLGVFARIHEQRADISALEVEDEPTASPAGPDAPPPEHHVTRLSTLGHADYFGEMALLDDAPRSATVRAETDGELLRLERARFLQLLEREPRIAYAVARTLSRRLRAADQTVLQSTRALGATVTQALDRLPPGRRSYVLAASLLDAPDAAVLRAAFGADVDVAVVARDVAAAGLGAEAPPSLVQALRDRALQELGSEAAETFAQEAAYRLAEEQHWDAALGLLARHGPRAAFLAVLGGALRAESPPPAARAEAWIAQVADDEAASDPDLALVRAAYHEARGDVPAAEQVLREALAHAQAGDAPADEQAAAGDAATPVGRLWAELARLAALEGPTGALPTYGATLSDLGTAAGGRSALLRRPRALVALGLSGLLVIAAAVAASASPANAFLLLLGAAVVLWVSELFPESAVGLGLLAAWMLLGIARPTQAMAGFASLNWAFVLAVLALAAGVARSGLLFRVGLLLVRRMPPGLFWQAGTLLLTGLLLTPLLPQTLGRAALVSPLALAVAEAGKLKDREPAAAALGLAAWIGASPLMFVFLNGSSFCLLAWGLLPEASRARMDWLHWLQAAAPLGLVASLGALVVIFLLLRPGVGAAPSREQIDLQIAVLGPPSRQELSMVVVLLLTLAGWVLGSLVSIDPGVVALLGLVAAVATGNLERGALQELDWNFLIYFGVALSMADLTVALGLDKAAAAAVGETLGQLGVSPLLYVLALALLSLAVRLVLPQTQGVLILALAFIPTAAVLGVDPWIVVITILATSGQWFIPSETNAYLVAYSATEGRLFSHGQARRVAFGYAAVVLLGLALSIPYWHLLGLL